MCFAQTSQYETTTKDLYKEKMKTLQKGQKNPFSQKGWESGSGHSSHKKMRRYYGDSQPRQLNASVLKNDPKTAGKGTSLNMELVMEMMDNYSHRDTENKRTTNIQMLPSPDDELNYIPGIELIDDGKEIYKMKLLEPVEHINGPMTVGIKCRIWVHKTTGKTVVFNEAGYRVSWQEAQQEIKQLNQLLKCILMKFKFENPEPHWLNKADPSIREAFKRLSTIERVKMMKQISGMTVSGMMSR